MKNKFTQSITILSLFLSFITISCQKQNDPPEREAVQIFADNMDFEKRLEGWTVEAVKPGYYGFSADTSAKTSGVYGLNFYAPQAGQWPGSPQETPWNGKIYMTITGLQDGTYTYKIFADAVGDGMYLWANGGATDAKVKIKSVDNEINSLDFVVKGGTAKIGFICINANGNPTLYAPYFHADNAQLWYK